MNKFLKKILIVLGVLAGLHLLLVVSGNEHLYPTLANTVFKGRLGPAIDEYTVQNNRIVVAGNYRSWPKSPKRVKVNSNEEKLHNELQTVAFVVVQNDTVRFEQYWDNYSADSRSNSFSMAKSLVSIAIGAAIQDGHIKSLDQTLNEFLPDFNGGENITLRNLLLMSSGINFDENYINPFAYPAKANYGNDLRSLTMGYKFEGQSTDQNVFKYLSGNSQLLSFVILAATGKNIADYFSERVWTKIGAKNDALWSLDFKDGLEKAFCCFNSNALDFARIGKLYLDSGRVNGEQVVPKWYVEESLTRGHLNEKTGEICNRYGYQWWFTTFKGKDVFYARGILGQYILVIPADELIVVRLGHKRIRPIKYEAPGEITAYLESAYRLSGLAN